MTAPALSLNDLRKSFGPAKIIQGVTLDIPKGEPARNRVNIQKTKRQ